MSRPIAPEGTIRVSYGAALAFPVDPVATVIPPNVTDSTATQSSRITTDTPLMSTSIVYRCVLTARLGPHVANHTGYDRIKGR
ncbi:hypothetical protein NJB1907f44_40740 [Mycobacterium marinum]|nr:hypothetical protein NJB1907f34b_15160 [Mycobacterium marinum]GJO04750.1 hypothetical protein NJB1907E90_13350 [Mycobacterium marinum]GJO10718.1 hypothetical protein NJB1808e29_46750 [Mycobacterium marinum]GJO13628.1 hypothetical protein NJB1907E11_09070 [Mycobacterium marinum]GJO15784.1 hypothetical protein NJB1507_02600 [Mycobacterium marinum]